MRVTAKVCGILILALLGGTAQAAIIVGNGDFETVDARTGTTLGNSDGDRLDSLAGSSGSASWDVFTSLPGEWVATAGGGIEVQTNKTVGGVTAHSGQHYIELDSEAAGNTPSNSVMKQNLGPLSSGAYELSFFYRPRTTGGETNRINVRIFDGVPIEDTIVSSDTSKWVEKTVGFVIPTSVTTDIFLEFAADGPSDEYGGFIDTVSISAVPVPFAGVLMLTAFGGAAAAYRRRHA